MSKKSVEEAVEVFGALASETRIRILQELGEKTLCVGALATRLEMTQSAVSQHLQVMRRARLVEADKRGSFVHYRLTENAGEQCREMLDRIVRDRSENGGLTMCDPKGCEHPEKLKSEPGECSPGQVQECHGDVAEHPCERTEHPCECEGAEHPCEG